MDKTDFVTTFAIIAVVSLLVGIGLGYELGFESSSDIHHKIDCENEYQFEPYTNVSSDCYKYFNIKK